MPTKPKPSELLEISSCSLQIRKGETVLKDYDGPENCKHEELDFDTGGDSAVCEACHAILHNLKDGDTCEGDDCEDPADVELWRLQ